METKSIVLLFIMTAFLTACAGNSKKTVQMAAKPIMKKHHSVVSQYPMSLPPPVVESRMRTVEDVVNNFGPYATGQLKPYFRKAGVAYPPREVTFIALKQEKKLEVWARDGGEFRFIRDYDVKAASGVTGPKLWQGDKQVPEGVYRIVGLNPNSNYHLSMKLNYPNEFDWFHAQREGRFDPGSDIFIHGNSVSAGCLAMGDEAIEELFVLTAQVGEENVKVIIAPRDPRLLPLDPEGYGLPSWTPELYRMIAAEMEGFSDAVKVSNNRPFYPASSPLR
ncbi:L,D-transpeptidase family protein [Methylocaldum sp.]|uniref:L,D-transpeptidase family protein n=1 Tax=Methylocaldum sp. TaxID=1969727 RepID=UPI002D5C22AF|nr:L,D-transpeptidase family protein [Methylocaldum sp.]HYE34914.1 L,D-transpeptidase family protein [Methylocaldum sp.]